MTKETAARWAEFKARRAEQYERDEKIKEAIAEIEKTKFPERLLRAVRGCGPVRGGVVFLGGAVCVGR